MAEWYDPAWDQANRTAGYDVGAWNALSPEQQAQYQQGGGAPTAPTAPQAGQWAPNNQGFLDWATQTYGASPARGGGFVDLPQGQNMQQVLQRYAQESGNQANFLGGPSGDRVDFGAGVQDALTSGGQIWNSAGGGGAPGGGGGTFRGDLYTNGVPGGGGNMALPTAPGVTPLTAPAPFSYAPNTQGAFAAPGGVPAYNPAAAPGQQTAQQVGTPAAWSGNRQATPGPLNATALATPAGYQYQNYGGLSAADLASDPSYQFRLQQGQQALENSAAAKGMLRGGNTARALLDYGQGAASQEYAAADARARATSAANNAGQLGAYQTNAQTGLAYNQNANQAALQFGQANIQNAFAANEANYGRGSTEAQQAFQNQLAAAQANNAANLAYGGQNFQQGFAVNQANNAGQAAQQGQAYNQALGAYGANQAAQQQNFAQALGAYGQNAQTGLAYGSQNQQNALANYQAQVQAALGQGNLNLGYTQAANQYALGQGNLGVQQGQLGLQQGAQDYNQALQSFLTNYQVGTTDPWNRNLQLAQLGQPVRPD